MKFDFPFFLIVNLAVLFLSCNNVKTEQNESLNNENELYNNFNRNFNILDSIVISDPDTDSFTCDGEIIKFMETHTGIKVDGTYFGKVFFTRENLANWHTWFKNELILSK
ncbi:MAG TPA: hypothetical protein V6C58_26995, partial [Allocoleopsis sp.]